MVGDAACHRAHDFEGVERRHARAGLRGLDAREGNIQPFRCRAEGEAQQHPFMVGPIILQCQRRADFAAEIVQQERILANLLRKEPLGQTRYERDAEGAAADLIRAADE